jgi:hypothetical protein
MIKPIRKMSVGTVFERGGVSYVVRAKDPSPTGSVHAFRDSDGVVFTFGPDDVGNEIHACDFALWTDPLPAAMRPS